MFIHRLYIDQLYSMEYSCSSVNNRFNSQMQKYITYLVSKPSTFVVITAFILSLIFNLIATNALNLSYSESSFPVPYYEAQLSFSPEKLKNWYSYLIENNSLDKYLTTQKIDFIFITSVFLLHFTALILISRLYSEKSLTRKLFIYSAFISTLAPIFDTLENLVSFIMLSNPKEFSNYWAYIYSTFSSIKFAAFTFAYIIFIIGVFLAIILFFKKVKNA